MSNSDLLYIPFGHRKIGHWTTGTGNQVIVKTREDIYGIVNQYLGIENIAISVCTYVDDVPYLLFIPFDFDSESNVKLAWLDAIKIYNHFVDLNYDVHITFSGKKGFHVLVGVVPKPYSKECLRAFQKWFISKLDLKTADIQILGDSKRLMRVPYTYNIRGTLCKEIAYNPGILIDIEDLLLTTYIPHTITYEKKEFHEYPCIEELMTTDPEPRELIRLSYVALRLAKGWTEDEIIDEMKTFDIIDFDEHLSRNKIGYIDNGNYCPLGCKSIEDMGYCLKEKCGHYNRFNGDVSKDMEYLGIYNGRKKENLHIL
jgi:hypothetical protein